MMKFNESIQDFNTTHCALIDAINTLSAKQKRLQQEQQLLSIGIMGQVKAGKSSFLNALLFGGKPILPEAATPKTANLTKISYGEKYTLTVEYYSEEEWNELCRQANSPDQSVSAIVARELVAMSERLSKDEIIRCLAQERDTFESINLDGLQGLLNAYTGNDGNYTALVKSTGITLPDTDLKGFEVVDTPGMNDPVQSRTQQTREYMSNCDVVFFLSRCSQFLDKSDYDLLSNQLPNKGVKRLVLVGGQYDSAILDDGADRDSLTETEQNLIKRLTRQAITKGSEIAAIKCGPESQQKLIESSFSKPIFASTFAHGFAQWPQTNWSKTMLHVHQQLQELAEDEWDYAFTQEDWLRIANFSVLKQTYEQAKTDRNVLLEEQYKSMLPDGYRTIISALEALQLNINERIKIIQSNDIGDIQNTEKSCLQRTTAISVVLRETLNKTRESARKDAQALLTRLQQDQLNFSKLTSRTGSRLESYSYEIDTSRWYNPFSWGSSETVHSTRSVSYNYVNASDAIEQLNQYAVDCSMQIESAFSRLISPTKIKQELRQTLLSELDTKSSDFNPLLFRSMIEGFIEKLTLPLFSMDLGNITKLIVGEFSGEITQKDKISELQNQLISGLQLILGQVRSEFKKQFDEIMDKLIDAGKSLESELTKDINDQLDALKLQIECKTKTISDYTELSSEIEKYKIEYTKKLEFVI